MYNRRFYLVAVPIILCFITLIARLAQLSLVQGEALAALASEQRLRGLDYYQYSRGDIVDRQGRPLVNMEQLCLILVPAMVEDSPGLAERLAPILEVDQAELEQRLTQGEKQQIAPFVLKSGLSPAQGEEIRRLELAGVLVHTLAARYAPQGVAGHVVGYVQAGEDAGSYQGVSGLELQYDAVLKNRRDQQLLAQVDAAGVLSGGGLLISPAEERDYNIVHTTLDRDYQQVVESAFSQLGYEGCCVIMEPDSGDILALASAPAFDPYFWRNEPESAYVNKALSLYHPASTIKVLLLLAAIEEGIDLPSAADQPAFEPEEEDENNEIDGIAGEEGGEEGQEEEVAEPFVCTGSLTLDNGHQVHCAGGKAHGTMNAEKALAQSCNCWFVALGQRLGGEKLKEYAERMGLTGLDIIGYETPDYRSYDFLHFSSAVPADLANVSLGEEGIRLTAVQQAMLTSACVNGGFLVRPRLVRAVTDQDGRDTAEFSVSPPRRVAAAKTAEILRLCLRETVVSGTGRAAAGHYLSAGGKTGSSESGAVWFCGFAPADQREWVIIVCVEDGSAGGVEAAAVFRAIIDGLALLGGKV